jgi:hypothetical protein
VLTLDANDSALMTSTLSRFLDDFSPQGEVVKSRSGRAIWRDAARHAPIESARAWAGLACLLPGGRNGNQSPRSLAGLPALMKKGSQFLPWLRWFPLSVQTIAQTAQLHPGSLPFPLSKLWQRTCTYGSPEGD